MFLDTFTQSSVAARGHAPSFARVANMLDLALAAGECAAALERDFGCKTDATERASALVKTVKNAPALWSDTSPEIGYRVGSLSIQHWENVHARCVREAETVCRLLRTQSRLAVGSTFVEPLARLQRKLKEGLNLLG